MQPIALAGLVSDDMEQTVLEVLGLLLGSVERGNHDGLAAAALAKNGNVLLQRSLQFHTGILREPVCFPPGHRTFEPE